MNTGRACKTSPDGVCRASSTCCCSMTADEPNEKCPVHGWPGQEKCEYCGRFMSYPEQPIDPVPLLANLCKYAREQSGTDPCLLADFVTEYAGMAGLVVEHGECQNCNAEVWPLDEFKRCLVCGKETI